MIIITGTGQVIEQPDPDPGGGTGGGGTQAPPLRPVRATYTVTLRGVDGTVWDLNRGPATIMAGTNLFDPPPVTHWRRKSPAVAGARWSGMRTEERSLVLPIRIAARTWDDYRAADQAFFKAIAPEGEVLVTVTSPDAISKTLPARWDSDSSGADDTDPLLLARKQHVLTFFADEPFWQGAPILRTFGLTSIPWLDPPGPPMFINAVSPLSAATIPNPGDVPAWPKYTITGPASSFRVGVGSSMIASSTPIPAGGQVVIDSSPAQRSILNGAGDRIYEQMSEVTFAPVPTGENVPVALGVFGFGASTSAKVELTPLYRRSV